MEISIIIVFVMGQGRVPLDSFFLCFMRGPFSLILHLITKSLQLRAGSSWWVAQWGRSAQGPHVADQLEDIWLKAIQMEAL